MPLKNNSVQIASIRRSQILESVTQANISQLLVNTSATTNDVVVEVPIARAISTTNITLSNAQTIDGVSIVDGDVVLVNGQTSEANNGLYFCVGSGAWERLTNPQPISGLPCIIREGGSFANTFWIEANEFAIYDVGVTNLKWVQIGAGGSYTVSDTNTIDMVMTGTVISANLRYEDGFTVDFTESSAGLKAEVVVQDTNTVNMTTASSGGLFADVRYQDTDSIDLSDNSSGLKADLRLDTAGANGIIPSITTDGLRLIHNFNAGLGVEFLANTPSGGAVQIKHNLTEGDCIELLANDPSTGNLKVQVEDDSISTAKIQDDAVTNAKMADDSVGANELLLVNNDGYIDFYSGAGTPTEQGIAFVASKVTHNWKRETINTGILTTTTHTLRMPPTAGDYYPQGVYHVDIYAAISVFNAFNQSLNNTAAPTLAVSINGGTAREIDKGLTHEDLVGGAHKMLNNSLQGSLIVDLTSSTMSERYFEIIFTLAINANANKSNATGYCDVFELKPAGTITYET